MKSANSASLRSLEDKTFLLLIIAVTLAFGWILWPFYGAVFWAIVLAILFTPLYRRLTTSMRQKRTPGALATLLIILVIVILPAAVITSLLLQEGFGMYQRVQSGEINFRQSAQQLLSSLPAWITSLLDRFGLTSPGALQERFSASVMKSVQYVGTQAFSFGQNALDFIVSFFVMLYLLFFLLRDGAGLVKRIGAAIPLDDDLQDMLSKNFANVIRATVKGNIVIALVQGALGGLAFAFLGIHAPVLWGVVMAFMSLLPAVGTALVWVPAALYLLATGDTWQGLALIAYGVLVIGLVDNVLRPVLVGKDTRMPDYIVLLSTIGGMAIFGLNGFVIGPVIAALFIAVWDVVATSRAGTQVKR
jgi:predicted PurR-regulated permease PerM